MTLRLIQTRVDKSSKRVREARDALALALSVVEFYDDLPEIDKATHEMRWSLAQMDQWIADRKGHE